jgi:hypothetical protein
MILLIYMISLLAHARHQHRRSIVLNRLQLLHFPGDSVLLRSFGLSPLQMSFVSFGITCQMVCQSRKRLCMEM